LQCLCSSVGFSWTSATRSNKLYLTFTFLCPLQRGIATHADGHSPLLLLRPSRAKIAVAIVSSGVIIATLFRPRTESPIKITRDSGTAANYTSTTDTATAASTVDASRYTLGIAMLLASLVCTGVHGALQERTYSTYGPYWRESIFYTVRPPSL
jgi:drug/metabolite transporter (DMT)-like permease